jgi:hypothetical protein
MQPQLLLVVIDVVTHTPGLILACIIVTIASSSSSSGIAACAGLQDPAVVAVGGFCS